MSEFYHLASGKGLGGKGGFRFYKGVAEMMAHRMELGQLQSEEGDRVEGFLVRSLLQVAEQL